MDTDGIFPSLLETLKGWIYTCALIILLINLFSSLTLPNWLVLSATIGAIVSFALDIISTIISIFSSISEGEVTALGVISTIVEIIVLVAAVLLFFCAKDLIMEKLNTLQWLATCIVGYHFAFEIVSMPFDLIALFIDDGDF